MANYFIAGRADDVGFATVERIGDCMQALLPAAVLTKFMLSPEDWEDFRENHIRNLLGYGGCQVVGAHLGWRT